MNDADIRLARRIATSATPLSGTAEDYDELLDSVGDARLVLIGEATHGTHEFYRERAQITKRLILEKGFVAIAAEADWPDAYRVNRFVHGQSEADDEAIDSLGDFRRFPQWMWRNADVLDFVGWLRSHNDTMPTRAASFYGLDLYSLRASMQAVLAFLHRVDPRAAERARGRYACFEDSSLDPHVYGFATNLGLTPACEDAAVAQLVELQRLRQRKVARDGYVDEDEAFGAEQDARVVVNAERYYREMFGGRTDSWNLREMHMVDTLDAIVAHLGRQGAAKLVVWAHNSHVGDARATQMHAQGQITVGQLVRERHPGQSVSIGLMTSLGTVSAASEWEEPVERKTILPPRTGSYEELFSEVGFARFFLDPRRFHGLKDALAVERLERAIGVIYKPETERVSHYFDARLPDQFDMVVHFDQTRAVEPIERNAEWRPEELPETYPSSL
ncbi:MAG: hypothetical protein JWN44_1983 [Myxococcales bacterium]|nr:hypothetical protein [Myxococcales bacterium]